MYNTDGNNILHTLLVKHYNDYLDRRSSGSGRGESNIDTCKLGTVFAMPLTLPIPNFGEKISAESSGKISQKS